MWCSWLLWLYAGEWVAFAQRNEQFLLAINELVTTTDLLYSFLRQCCLLFQMMFKLCKVLAIIIIISVVRFDWSLMFILICQSFLCTVSCEKVSVGWLISVPPVFLYVNKTRAVYAGHTVVCFSNRFDNCRCALASNRMLIVAFTFISDGAYVNERLMHASYPLLDSLIDTLIIATRVVQTCDWQRAVDLRYCTC